MSQCGERHAAGRGLAGARGVSCVRYTNLQLHGSNFLGGRIDSGGEALELREAVLVFEFVRGEMAEIDSVVQVSITRGQRSSHIKSVKSVDKVVKTGE